MTVMTLDNNRQNNVVLSTTQLTAVALLVVLALAITLMLLFAAPTVEHLRFNDFRILPNDFAHFAVVK